MIFVGSNSKIYDFDKSKYPKKYVKYYINKYLNIFVSRRRMEYDTDKYLYQQLYKHIWIFKSLSHSAQNHDPCLQKSTYLISTRLLINLMSIIFVEEYSISHRGQQEVFPFLRHQFYWKYMCRPLKQQIMAGHNRS